MINKKIALSLATFAAAGGLVFSAGNAQAFVSENNSGFFAQLAQKFGKSETEVTQIMEETRQERHTQAMQGFEGRLEKAVMNGELTAEQKQLLVEKRAELQANCDSSGERKQLNHDELTSWAEQNGIDPSFLMGKGPGNGEGLRLGENGQGKRMYGQNR